MCSLNFMFISLLIEELCTKEENNKTGCTLTFRGQCKCFKRHQTSHSDSLHNKIYEENNYEYFC